MEWRTDRDGISGDGRKVEIKNIQNLWEIKVNRKTSVNLVWEGRSWGGDFTQPEYACKMGKDESLGEKDQNQIEGVGISCTLDSIGPKKPGCSFTESYSGE